METLEDIISKRFEIELLVKNKVFICDSKEYQDLYLKLYEDAEIYVDKTCFDLDDFYRKYLTLYTTNSNYRAYKRKSDLYKDIILKTKKEK